MAQALIHLATEVASSYVRSNQVPIAAVPELIRSIHATLAGLSVEAHVPHAEPAVPVKKSVADSHIVCLEDGKHLTMLKRYLRTHYNMSPDDYRRKWSLPVDYPMVAPAYARMRSAFAKKIKLGHIPTGRGKRK